MSDLIVIGYPDEATAQNVWKDLLKLQHDNLVDLEDAAIVRRDRNGKLHITTPAHHAVAWGTFSGLFWGVLIGLLFLFPLAPLVGVAGGIMGAALGAAGNLGIKDDFRQRVQDLVQPGTAALRDYPCRGCEPAAGAVRVGLWVLRWVSASVMTAPSRWSAEKWTSARRPSCSRLCCRSCASTARGSCSTCPASRSWTAPACGRS